MPVSAPTPEGETSARRVGLGVDGTEARASPEIGPISHPSPEELERGPMRYGSSRQGSTALPPGA